MWKLFVKSKASSDIKDHIEKEHKTDKYFHHIKMNRTDDKRVSLKKMYVEEVKNKEM